MTVASVTSWIIDDINLMRMTQDNNGSRSDIHGMTVHGMQQMIFTSDGHGDDATDI